MITLFERNAKQIKQMQKPISNTNSTQEPYCYKSTLALLPQNAKTIPSDRTGHPRASITASNRLQMAEISELKHRDLAAGLVTLEGKKQ